MSKPSRLQAALYTALRDAESGGDTSLIKARLAAITKMQSAGRSAKTRRLKEEVISLRAENEKLRAENERHTAELVQLRLVCKAAPVTSFDEIAKQLGGTNG
jgi:hypothetical protein